jgi:amino acid permease
MTVSNLICDPEKGSAIAPVVIDQEASSHDQGTVKVLSPANLDDERYNTTKRGLRSRHAQMIALGGAIGTG